MLYLDESGDDGQISETGSDFFIVCVYFDEISTYKKVNKSIRDFLDYKNIDLKWNKLTKNQKSLFLEYVKGVDYKVFSIGVDKAKIKDFSYGNMLYNLLIKTQIKKGKVVYKGLHLKNTFAKVSFRLKSFDKRITFVEQKNTEYLGVEIADIFAGYVHHCMRYKIKINDSINFINFQT